MDSSKTRVDGPESQRGRGFSPGLFARFSTHMAADEDDNDDDDDDEDEDDWVLMELRFLFDSVWLLHKEMSLVLLVCCLRCWAFCVSVWKCVFRRDVMETEDDVWHKL